MEKKKFLQNNLCALVKLISAVTSNSFAQVLILGECNKDRQALKNTRCRFNKDRPHYLAKDFASTCETDHLQCVDP